jgi:hypothetical protein
MKNKSIYLDEDKIKCLMEAQESVVSPSKAKAECGLNDHLTTNQNNAIKGVKKTKGGNS